MLVLLVYLDVVPVSRFLSHKKKNNVIYSLTPVGVVQHLADLILENFYSTYFENHLTVTVQFQTLYDGGLVVHSD